MDVENDLEREKRPSSDTEETDAADCFCEVSEPYDCDCGSCGLDGEDYCC